MSFVVRAWRRRRAFVYTDFTDELSEIEEVELREIRVGADFERFREKARAYLREHEDHLALQRLRRNLPLTDTDIEQLERMLREAGIGSPEDLERASREERGLGGFIRSLVGLDRDAATDALSGFIDGKTLSADQHEFVAMIVEQLTMNGSMDLSLLYEPPFTTLAPGGPEALFADAEVDDLITAIRAVDTNIRPKDEAA
jgi:type I restriction enzyme, R subunit